MRDAARATTSTKIGRARRRCSATVEPHELVDPQVEAERLLFRLFHEDGVRVFEHAAASSSAAAAARTAS